jgi:hypothetical protein
VGGEDDDEDDDGDDDDCCLGSKPSWDEGKKLLSAMNFMDRLTMMMMMMMMVMMMTMILRFLRVEAVVGRGQEALIGDELHGPAARVRQGQHPEEGHQGPRQVHGQPQVRARGSPQGELESMER